MKHVIVVTVICCSGLLFAGCAPQQKMYHFGNYSQTLYHNEKNQTAESLSKHKQELERIIAESETKNLPVPPGIYAELGYLNMKENNSKEAVRLFETEVNLYPESKHLMERLIQSVDAQDDSHEDKPVTLQMKNEGAEAELVRGDEIEK